MKLSITNNTNAKVDESIFQDVLKSFKTDHEEVELLLTNDAEIRVLNKTYRKKDKATDVLSFPLNDTKMLGQIVISVETAKKQAKDLKQTLEEELKFLFAHALLHLSGYDHEDPEEEKAMLKETYRLLNRN